MRSSCLVAVRALYEEELTHCDPLRDVQRQAVDMDPCAAGRGSSPTKLTLARMALTQAVCLEKADTCAILNSSGRPLPAPFSPTSAP